MSQQTVTQYVCDNCTRKVFSATAPVGWSSVTFIAQTQTVLENADVCDSCSDAFITTMSKRKQIESGRHRERELTVHNPIHPMNAGYSPFKSRTVAKEANEE